MAERETGLADFGDDAYRANLAVLLDCYEEESLLGDAGRDATCRTLVDCLKSRLYSTRSLAQHPESLATPIAQPLVIAGLPRTGSTALHKLIAAAPGFQALEYWLGRRPDVRPPRSEWPDHPGYRAALAELDRIYASSPELRTAHSMQAAEPDECRLLFMQDFVNVTFSFNATIPGYERWLFAQDLAPAYLRYRNHLKLIGARTPERRWVLKNASHLISLPALANTFSDVCVVQTHRSPLEWISSVASLVYKSRVIYEPDVDKESVGEQQLRQWSQVVERSWRDRRALGDRVLDLHYDHFVSNPVATVRRIYAHFDWAWSAETERAVGAWAADHPQHGDGVHRYSAAEYGLSERTIADRFADYIEWEQSVRASA
jgi:hypothetical protein